MKEYKEILNMVGIFITFLFGYFMGNLNIKDLISRRRSLFKVIREHRRWEREMKEMSKRSGL